MSFLLWSRGHPSSSSSLGGHRTVRTCRLQTAEQRLPASGSGGLPGLGIGVWGLGTGGWGWLSYRPAAIGCCVPGCVTCVALSCSRRVHSEARKRTKIDRLGRKQDGKSFRSSPSFQDRITDFIASAAAIHSQGKLLGIALCPSQSPIALESPARGCKRPTIESRNAFASFN